MLQIFKGKVLVIIAPSNGGFVHRHMKTSAVVLVRVYFEVLNSFTKHMLKNENSMFHFQKYHQPEESLKTWPPPSPVCEHLARSG